MAGAPASVVPRDALLQALLSSMPFQVTATMTVCGCFRGWWWGGGDHDDDSRGGGGDGSGGDGGGVRVFYLMTLSTPTG